MLLPGLPVVTLPSELHVSRVASSLVSSGGGPNLIARTLKEYEDMVVALAEQQGTRRRFREEFAKRMGGGIPSETGSLWDVQAFARGYEVSCDLN